MDRDKFNELVESWRTRAAEAHVKDAPVAAFAQMDQLLASCRDDLRDGGVDLDNETERATVIVTLECLYGAVHGTEHAAYGRCGPPSALIGKTLTALYATFYPLQEPESVDGD